MNSRIITVSESCQLNSCNINPQNTPKYIYYLDTGNITRNNINNIQYLESISEKYPSRAKRKVQHKTIIYSTVRPNQEHFGILNHPHDNLVVSTGFTTIDVIDDELDPLYFYYSITRKDITNYLQLIAENSVSSYPSINSDDIAKLKLRVPISKQLQEEIAAVLSALDAKIELNNRINAELESLAKTIYYYWFVQFDFPYDFDRSQPDQQGKPYKSSGGKMVYSEVLDREIPTGWEVGKLGDIGMNIRNGIKKTDLHPEMSYIGLEHIPRKQIALDSWSKAVDLASNKYLFTKRNILFGKLRPYFHKVGVAFVSGVCSTDILVLDSQRESCYGYFLMLVSSDDFINYVTIATEGTRMPRTNWSHRKSYPIPISEDLIFNNFNDILKPLVSRIENNIHQNQQLNQLRNWLLPMLMNGQVRVE